MARYIFKTFVKDGIGRNIAGAQVSVTLSGTTTSAITYPTVSSTTPNTSITTAADGGLVFYVDGFDYDFDQTFDVTVAKNGYSSVVFPSVLPVVVLGSYTISSLKTITTKMSVPEGVMYVKSGSGALAFAAGSSLTAGEYQIFSGFAASDITGLSEVKPEWGGSTDTTGMQFAMDCVANSGGKVVLKEKKSYTITSALTMISTDTTAGRASKVMVIEGNDATLDFSSGSWVADYSAGDQINLLNFGTVVNSDPPNPPTDPDPQANPKALIEAGLAAIRNLRIIGNEVVRPTTPDGSTKPLTGTVGLRLQLALDTQISNVFISNVTVGVETRDSWGISADTVKVRNSWIGLKVMGGSTYATWKNFAAVQCAYGVVMQSSRQQEAPFYGAFSAISQQYFINPRTEDLWYGWVLYAHDADIKGVHIDGGYVEDIGRDWMIAGMTFVTASSSIYNPTTPTDPSPSKVDRLQVMNLGKISFGGGYYAIRTYESITPTSESVVHSKMILPVVASDVKGVFKGSSIEFLGAGSVSGGADIGPTGSTLLTDNLSGVVRKIITKTGLTDNVATAAFKITTPSLASHNGGAYSVHVHGLVSHIAVEGTSSVSGKSFEANFVHVINDVGTTAASSAVSEVVETASAAISSPSRNVGTVTMTVAEGASKFITNVLFQIDATGADATTPEVTLMVELVYKGFVGAPVIEVL